MQYLKVLNQCSAGLAINFLAFVVKKLYSLVIETSVHELPWSAQHTHTCNFFIIAKHATNALYFILSCCTQFHQGNNLK